MRERGTGEESRPSSLLAVIKIRHTSEDDNWHSLPLRALTAPLSEKEIASRHFLRARRSISPCSPSAPAGAVDAAGWGRRRGDPLPRRSHCLRGAFVATREGILFGVIGQHQWL